MFIFSPDDLIVIRETANQAVRDNVILELGLFLGHLGKSRCFILVPDDDADLRIPTDLMGVTPAKYETGRSDENFQAATGPACNSIRQSIRQIGPHSIEAEAPNVAPVPPVPPTKDEAVQIEEDSSDGEHRDREWLRFIIDNDYRKAIELLEIKISAETNEKELSELESWIAFAQCQIDPKVGIEIFEELVNKYPTYSLPYDLFAYSLKEKGLYPKCLEVLDIGLSKVTNKVSLVLEKTRYLKEIGRDEDVKTMLMECISQSPDEPDYYEGLAQYYIEAENYNDAKLCLEDGLSKMPASKPLLFKYAKLLYDHFDKKWALILYDQLVSTFSEDPECLTLRANIYVDLDLNNLAMCDYQSANELAKQKESWIHANIGNLYKNRGFYSEGIKYLQSAIEINTESEYAHDRLAASIKLRDEEVKKLTGIAKQAKKDLLASRINTQELNPE